MAHAIQLAELGRYTTAPNPCVGCVLVQGERVIGTGYHRRAGEPHAERLALAAAEAAGENPARSTAYVTLEPCCHHGRTPPCTDALIAAAVRRVVVAMPDPNPLVAGRGIAQLRHAGIAVTVGVLDRAAQLLNLGFCKRMTSGMPFVKCKLAASLDGRTALASGESCWITGEAARRDVQRWRARSAAIMTGVGTVLIDNPALTVRINPETGIELTDLHQWPQPLRVITDSQLRTPPTAQLLHLPGKTLIATGADVNNERAAALIAAGAELFACELNTDGRIELTALVRELATRGCNEVLLETGATLAGAAMQAGLIDELIIYLAPHLLGDSGRGLFTLLGIDRMNQRIELEWQDVRQVGNDLRLTLRPINAA
ncbi:bifunctional diaminohydroxyphosphoribosylaminopyrimidine deaminase/5-amino-6-(5-phosphoribosylamino)uracil reductase RibD [Rhodoferax sp. 4810]|uniref:Riboflavin biosynthesis protein RibD n=2 Tax=Thiospirillum jenense TaxID=1653858 RepID=A0A839HEH7_9GAMM|nr:bifunctional diaminohydroxyphosphoribosylaminopyrimidine deaminase/5-amino-6-(5-phosphoribosylamino)uracil reductase RibD [Rhodoferax jenense]MBB1126874.1 bifunctional diaminohydroxyphosphoribosylaminopyrimidine deaminase/5-amino-6-(5-phosphoribosylamino)uracil reductase RibD [Thiospirillum jenense]